MTSLVLGAPGIYREPERADRAYGGVRLDVTGFVGAAPRGPVGEAVRVENWSEYRRRFGGYEGPGRLPYAVSAFFEQGGERAYIVRVAPRAEPSTAVAVYELTGLGLPAGAPPVLIAATNEGSWGNELRIRLAFEASRQFQLAGRQSAEDVEDGAVGIRVEIPDGFAVPVGSLLRVRAPGTPAREIRWVTALEGKDIGLRRRHYAVLDRPVVLRPSGAELPTVISVVDGVVTIDDLDSRIVRSEVHPGLGLHPGHPRWLAHVLGAESGLVEPVGAWQEQAIEPASALLPPATTRTHITGHDRYGAIEAGDFFDEPWDPISERSYRGVHALLAVEEIGLVVVPDLLWESVEPPAPGQSPPDPDPAPPFFVRCPPDFAGCGPSSPAGVPRPAGSLALLVDARTQEGFDEAVRRQQQLVAVANLARRFTVLLDVPPDLPASRVSRWRSYFDSRHAAAYHPWLWVAPPDDDRPERVQAAPSGFAAGIIAGRERRVGLPTGPANELAIGALAVGTLVTSAEHDMLHPIGINVFTAERDGMRLTGARTISSEPIYRQLSVSRLMTMLRLMVERESQWMVFEGNHLALWTSVRFHLEAVLSLLYGQGAFAGVSESEAFFVHCDERLNPRASRDAGRLIVEVGVAPAEPLEFIVLRIERQVEGGIRVEEVGG